MHPAVGVSGSIYAVWRWPWAQLPAGLILDDLYLPMRLALAGWRVGLVPDAYAHETRRVVAAQEFRRKAGADGRLPAVREAAWGARAVAVADLVAVRLPKAATLFPPAGVLLVGVGGAGIVLRARRAGERGRGSMGVVRGGARGRVGLGRAGRSRAAAPGPRGAVREHAGGCGRGGGQRRTGPVGRLDPLSDIPGRVARPIRSSRFVGDDGVVWVDGLAATPHGGERESPPHKVLFHRCAGALVSALAGDQQIV